MSAQEIWHAWCSSNMPSACTTFSGQLTPAREVEIVASKSRFSLVAPLVPKWAKATQVGSRPSSARDGLSGLFVQSAIAFRDDF